MDPETRRIIIDSHQQELRNEAAAQRLARGAQDRLGSPHPTAKVARTIGAWRRLIGATGV